MINNKYWIIQPEDTVIYNSKGDIISVYNKNSFMWYWNKLDIFKDVRIMAPALISMWFTLIILGINHSYFKTSLILGITMTVFMVTLNRVLRLILRRQ